MRIEFEFAKRDDCLDQMVPSDLRHLVVERDMAVSIAESRYRTISGLVAALELAAYYDDCTKDPILNMPKMLRAVVDAALKQARGEA